MCLSIADSSVVCGSLFTVDPLLSLPTCCLPLSFLAAGLFVFIVAFTYHLHGSGLFIPLLQQLGLIFFIHCIIITRISPSIVASSLVYCHFSRTTSS